MIYKKILSPLLFMFDSESIHHLTLATAEIVSNLGLASLLKPIFEIDNSQLAVELGSLKFNNPIGLAAGFSKDAEALPCLAALGFGHIEVGTITAIAQPGNERPRVFRYPAEQALINRMGFPSLGADQVFLKLDKIRQKHKLPVIGVNIGKSKQVPIEDAISDYSYSFEKLYPVADYFTVNVSSPNTPGLRTLQNAEHLNALLDKLQEQNVDQKALFLKIAPDLDHAQIDEITTCCLEKKLSGIIATNTTIERPGSFAEVNEQGGLSGKPLHDTALEIVRYIYKQTNGELPIIGAGGISSGDAAVEMLRAGASAIQLYTGLVFSGPTLPREICKGILKRLNSESLDAVGDFKLALN